MAEPTDCAMTMMETAMTLSLGPNQVAANFVLAYKVTCAAIEGKICPSKQK